jgi:hypothetical protein
VSELQNLIVLMFLSTLVFGTASAQMNETFQSPVSFTLARAMLFVV